MQHNAISVIGLGYIGLPTAAIFAAHGKKVIGVDINRAAVDTINAGKIHIIEPDLDRVVHEVVSAGLLTAATEPAPADAFLIAVPTPFGSGYQPDLSYIESAAKAIAPVLAAGNLVILESTSPVGTTQKLEIWLSQLRPDLRFPSQWGNDANIHIAYCPERVLPGRVLHELISNDRIIGGLTKECAEAAASLYKIFVKGDCILTNARTAEMCKLTENSFRDVNIAFANELSLICDDLGIDVWELIRLANRHPRVSILNPGPGVGGHCIAVDPWFIVSQSPQHAKLIRTAREINNYKPHWVQEKIKLLIEETQRKGRTQIQIACLGLAFKPDIDDLRESPAVEIVAELAQRFPMYLFNVVEPNIEKLPQSLERSNTQLLKLEDALGSSDIILGLVRHKEFCGIDLNRLNTNNSLILDAAGIWSI